MTLWKMRLISGAVQLHNLSYYDGVAVVFLYYEDVVGAAIGLDWKTAREVAVGAASGGRGVKNGERIPSTTPGAEPPRDARDSGSARSHSTHLETSSSERP